jgi:hypothetical protein
MSDVIEPQVEYTNWILIQDIKLCGTTRYDDTVVVNGKRRRRGDNGNPGVWYIEDPLGIKVGDVIQGYKIVDIKETMQPTLRNLHMVKDW